MKINDVKKLGTHKIFPLLVLSVVVFWIPTLIVSVEDCGFVVNLANDGAVVCEGFPTDIYKIEKENGTKINHLSASSRRPEDVKIIRVALLFSSHATVGDWGGNQFSPRSIFQFVKIRGETLGEGGYVLE